MIPPHPITGDDSNAPVPGQPAVIVYDSAGYQARFPLMPGDDDGRMAAAAGRQYALIHCPGAVVRYFTGTVRPDFVGGDLRSGRVPVKGLWWKAYLWLFLALLALAVGSWLAFA